MNSKKTFTGETSGVCQEGTLAIELFLNENYRFRRNTLNGKVEFATLPKAVKTTEGNTVGISDSLSSGFDEANLEFRPLTPAAQNSIVIRAKKEEVLEKGSPKAEISEWVGSEEVPEYNPIQDYLNCLPKWDGQNHIAKVFSRLPGVSSEQLNYLTIWLRSAVAHWMQMDMLHGNEWTSEPLEQVRQGDGADEQPLRQPRRTRGHPSQPAGIAEADAECE